MPAGSTYWIREGMLDGKLENVDLDHDGVVDHVCFSIRNQFMHPNHPLGWIRDFRVCIDGAEMPREEVCFVVRDQWVGTAEMRTITDIWWHMREKATIYVGSGELAPGKHRVECSISISLHVNTPTIDREDLWPWLTLDLSADLETGGCHGKK